MSEWIASSPGLQQCGKQSWPVQYVHLALQSVEGGLESEERRERWEGALWLRCMSSELCMAWLSFMSFMSRLVFISCIELSLFMSFMPCLWFLIW